MVYYYKEEQMEDLINVNQKKHDKETKLLLKLNKVLNKFKPSEKEIKDYTYKSGNVYIIYQKIGKTMYFKNCKIHKTSLNVGDKDYRVSSTCQQPINEDTHEIGAKYIANYFRNQCQYPSCYAVTNYYEVDCI